MGRLDNLLELPHWLRGEIHYRCYCKLKSLPKLADEIMYLNTVIYNLLLGEKVKDLWKYDDD